MNKENKLSDAESKLLSLPFFTVEASSLVSSQTLKILRSLINFFESMSVNEKKVKPPQQTSAEQNSENQSQGQSITNYLSDDDKHFIAAALYKVLNTKLIIYNIVNFKFTKDQNKNPTQKQDRTKDLDQDQDQDQNQTNPYDFSELLTVIKTSLQILFALKNIIHEAKKKQELQDIVKISSLPPTASQFPSFLSLVFKIKKNIENTSLLKFKRTQFVTFITDFIKEQEKYFQSSLRSAVRQLKTSINVDNKHIDSFVVSKRVDPGETDFRINKYGHSIHDEPITAFAICVFRYFDWFLEIIYPDMLMVEIYNKEEDDFIKGFLARFLLLLFWTNHPDLQLAQQQDDDIKSKKSKNGKNKRKKQNNPKQTPNLQESCINFIIDFLKKRERLEKGSSEDDNDKILRLFLQQLLPADVF